MLVDIVVRVPAATASQGPLAFKVVEPSEVVAMISGARGDRHRIVRDGGLPGAVRLLPAGTPADVTPWPAPSLP